MAQVRDPAFNPSSPHSSSAGGDSYKHEGTPETRLTVFSPDDNSARSNKLLNTLSLSAHSDHAVRFNVKPEAFGDAGVTSEKDPFISSTTALKGEQKLSPTASAFRPVSVPIVARGSLSGPPGPNVGLNANRQLFAPQSTAKFSHQLGISRCLVIYSRSGQLTVADIEGYLAKLERLGSPCQGKSYAVSAHGKVYLRLANVRDARNAHDNAELGSSEWCADYVVPSEYNEVCGQIGHAEPVFDCLLQVTAFGQGVNAGTAHVETVVQTLLETQGEVFALLRQSEPNDYAFRAVVEFSDAELAISVAHRFNGATVGGVNLILTPCQLDIESATLQTVDLNLLVNNPPRTPVHNVANVNVFQGRDVWEGPHAANAIVAAGRVVQSPAGFHAPQQFAMYPVVYQGITTSTPSRLMVSQTPTRVPNVSQMGPISPLSGDLPIMSPLYTTPPGTPMAMTGDFSSPRSIQPYGRLENRRQNAMRVNRSPYGNAGHHNHVDVNRIRDGIDVRTTIMLRNIPNKVDQAMLKRIIDESSWGKYDFMYLRIDFANDCNVGYAFINFVDPLDIIDFVNARGNQRWNCFKSDKVAEISYATIQGKDCLVQKFRNSSVMLEAPHYRPKLYYTTNGPRPELAGQEEPFPEPDNQSKMKRSCENAEHVGLFTPNAGQHFRDEQRRRRSQYDRGTRLAALEEYDYAAHIQQHGFFVPQ
ncbi:meiosis protein mei2 [Achaetomium macrosporum]|uniref:Meiosis protein mei2 n=1 Tax=Achaetomium macrosporum TaxID=79813 RepID=A0AAN7CBQ7_9PEZI|nr:meiosis protein mei2 [Achaetomium macrosporum]